MSRLDLRRFARPDTLKAVDPTLLRTFLRATAADYLRAFDLDADPLDYDALSEALATPAPGYPVDLAEALYFANDFAKDRNACEFLLDRATAAGLVQLDVAPAHALAPVALVLALWILPVGRQVVCDVHAEHCTAHPRSFEAWQPADDAIDSLPIIDADGLARFTSNMDAFFRSRRGLAGGVKVFRVNRGASTWVIVRQPAPWERRTYVESGGSETTKQGHPEDYDVLIYTPEYDELAIHAASKAEVDRYRDAFGLCFCGDLNRFSTPVRMNLEPLRTLGSAALSVDGVDGVHEIAWVEVGFAFHGANDDRMIRKSKDLFLTHKGHPLPRGTIQHAVFAVKLGPDGPLCSVRVYAGARTSYTRDAVHDGIRRWLDVRGFTRRRTQTTNGGTGVETWPQIAAEIDRVMPAAEWSEVLGPTIGVTRALLRPQGMPSPTMACGMNAFGCRRMLVGCDDDLRPRYRCGREPTACDAVTVERGVASGQMLSGDAIADRLSMALALDEAPTEVPEPDVRLWRLGSRHIGGVAVEFWFTPAVDEQPVLAAIAAVLSRHKARVACLWVPSTANLPARVLTAHQVEFVGVHALNECATEGSEGMKLDL